MAGPVTVCALALPYNLKLPTKSLKLKLRDSKKLSPKQREAWFEWVKEQKIYYALSSISPSIIDKINISQAANLASTRAVLKLIKKIKSADKYEIKMDGGLKLLANSLKLKAKSYIKGDELIPAISLASIIAKVHRDSLMIKLHKKLPQYSFDRHKGYGTKLHIKMIKKHGLSDIHRKTFTKNI